MHGLGRIIRCVFVARPVSFVVLAVGMVCERIYVVRGRIAFEAACVEVNRAEFVERGLRGKSDFAVRRRHVDIRFGIEILGVNVLEEQYFAQPFSA